MATWFVEYRPYIKSDPDFAEPAQEIPCFRIFSGEEPEHWIARTNEELPPEVQEEAALIMAAALSKALG
jgi:hypothetical protein